MSDIEAYPRQPHEGLPEPSRRAHIVKTTLTIVGVLAGLGLVIATCFGVLIYAFNPVADEWHCSDGEAPAGNHGSYGGCHDKDKPLPRGYEWDPFGNRPIASNCDKDGWVLIERPVRGKGVGNTLEDCVREGTDLPGSWRLVEED